MCIIDRIGAILGCKGGGIFVRNGVAVGIALGNGAAIHTGQRGPVSYTHLDVYKRQVQKRNQEKQEYYKELQGGDIK